MGGFSLYYVFTGCPRNFRNRKKTFIRLSKTAICQKKEDHIDHKKMEQDINLNKFEGPANV